MIRNLCQVILEDHLEVFRLHAGVTDDKLIRRMKDLIGKAKMLPKNKRLWIFFDEFNTIGNVSLLKEIVCERTLLGEPLPENMVFLGTCNPQRQKPHSCIFGEDVGIRKNTYATVKLAQYRQKFLYNVGAIPETMLEYVWDYGQLDSVTEKSYIEAMLKSCPGLSTLNNWAGMIVKLISVSHQFLRNLEDVSSVSLRDVARYCRLYRWYKTYLHNTYQYDVPLLIQEASLLALLICYYFRLDTKEKKGKYLATLNHYLSPLHNNMKRDSLQYLEKILEDAENQLLAQMNLPNDMVLNRALKENIFVLFSCIMNQIPVFLCGKPGASKTSAVQILMTNLKGPCSTHPRFRELPELGAVTFQGSQNCTSNNIEQVFERAEKRRQIEADRTKLLPVIIFDEIGLAELSVHNPLKVLHEQLEMEECRFGFVGLSNLRLDASKMSRVLYVACIDPDVEDLQLIGEGLSRSIPQAVSTIPFDTNILRGLANAYLYLQGEMKKTSRQENYFGLRDYYSLIKGINHDYQANQTLELYEVIYRRLVINFGGFYQGYKIMWKIFCASIDQGNLVDRYSTPSPQDLIQQSLLSRRGRHLMLITDRESTIDHVERFLTRDLNARQSVKTLVGSQFEGDIVSDDIYTDAYTTRVLMDIILYSETPTTLIMRRMDHLYDNPYDLFNQNFTGTDQRKFCRIALSATYNPHCYIDDQFFCVVPLNAEEVIISDPPFLNRFEKHFVRIDQLTQPKQWSLTLKAIEWLRAIPLPKASEHFPLLQHLIMPYSPDYICNLVNQVCDDGDLEDEMILDACKTKLIRASSFDFAVVLSLLDDQALLERYYQVHATILSLRLLISSTQDQSSGTKRIIYTYTPIYDSIDYDASSSIREIKLSNLKTELDLINFLKVSSEMRTPTPIVILRLDYHREYRHVLSVKYNILNQWQQLQHVNLWLIFHVQRNKLHQVSNDVFFDQWDVLMIDDLNHPQLQ